MPTLDDIKNYDDWDYYRLGRPILSGGVVYSKFAMAIEPILHSNRHAVLLIADDLTLMVLPRDEHVYLTIGNTEKVTLNNIVFGRD